MHKTIGTPPCTLGQPWVSVLAAGRWPDTKKTKQKKPCIEAVNLGGLLSRPNGGKSSSNIRSVKI